ncbi:MAG: hypothetical protein IT423_22470 [Pirellulaceae bacterium]|nr:hypothetical protein [Pirellulaceae bacterium]
MNHTKILSVLLFSATVFQCTNALDAQVVKHTSNDSSARFRDVSDKLSVTTLVVNWTPSSIALTNTEVIEGVKGFENLENLILMRTDVTAEVLKLTNHLPKLRRVAIIGGHVDSRELRDFVKQSDLQFLLYWKDSSSAVGFLNSLAPEKPSSIKVIDSVDVKSYVVISGCPTGLLLEEMRVIRPRKEAGIPRQPPENE